MNRAIAWFARNHVAANLLMALMLIGGLFALPRIEQRAFPDMTIDVIAINVEYLGAAPEEVEQGVCIRIEEEIHGLDGIEKITSSAAEGACGVSAEIIDGYPIDRALSEIKNAVDSIDTFPEETEKPIVSHVDPPSKAVELAVSADASELALRLYGERIRDSLSSLPNITQVELGNVRDYEISIEVSEEALQRYGLTFDEVVAAVRRGSLDRPGGSLKTSGGEILLRTKGQAYTGPEFEQIVPAHGSGRHAAAPRRRGDRRRRLRGRRSLRDLRRRAGREREGLPGRRPEGARGRRHGPRPMSPSSRSRLPEGLSLTVWDDDSARPCAIASTSCSRTASAASSSSSSSSHSSCVSSSRSGSPSACRSRSSARSSSCSRPSACRST